MSVRSPLKQERPGLAMCPLNMDNETKSKRKKVAARKTTKQTTKIHCALASSRGRDRRLMLDSGGGGL